METNMSNPFDSYVANERQPMNINRLAPGQYLVKVERLVRTNDKMVQLGEAEDDVVHYRDWDDTNPVLYAYLTCPEGVFHQRFYWYGYMLMEEMVRDARFKDKLHEFRSTTIKGVRQYAIHRESNARLVDERKTAYCKQLIDQFATAAGCANKTIDEMIGQELWIEVTESIVFGKRKAKLLRVASKEAGFKVVIAGKTIDPGNLPLPKGLL